MIVALACTRFCRYVFAFVIKMNMASFIYGRTVLIIQTRILILEKAHLSKQKYIPKHKNNLAIEVENRLLILKGQIRGIEFFRVPCRDNIVAAIHGVLLREFRSKENDHARIRHPKHQ